mgnify:FL=1
MHKTDCRPASEIFQPKGVVLRNAPCYTMSYTREIFRVFLRLFGKNRKNSKH